MLEHRMPAFHMGSGAQRQPFERSHEPSSPRPGRAVVAARWIRRHHATSPLLLLLVAITMVATSPLVSAAQPALGQGPGRTPGLPSPTLVPLVNSDGVLPAGAVALGAASPTRSLTFSLEINIPASSGAQAFINALETPGSPSYHHYVSGESFVRTYGPSPTERAALLAYLRGDGLTVSQEDDLGLLYLVTGSVVEIDAALHITMTSYRSGSTVALAPSSAPALPAPLAPWVESFYALNGLDLAHPDYLVDQGSHGGASSASPPAHPSAVMTPADLQGGYDATPLITGGDTGSKFTIGLAEMCDPTQASTTYQTDINSYDTANSLPSITITLSDDTGSCSSGSTGWGLETDLDIESSHSLATGAALNVCLDNTNPATCDSNFVSAGIVIASNSWGMGTSGAASLSSIWSTAAAAGDTLLASSGDSCSTTPPNDPALEPDGIGVGGTSLTVSGTAWSSETVWDTTCTGINSGGEGTGGGCDASVTPPAYQVGMTGYPGACSSTSDRGVPDVGADADPATGLNVVSSNPGYCATIPCTLAVGGTSLASPLWAAGLTLVYQSSGWTGFFGPEIYALAKSTGYTNDFHQITSGSNGYAATSGWDPDTGVGSPILAAMAASVISPLVVTVSESAGTVEAGTPVTFTASVSGGSTPYTYQWFYNTSGSVRPPPGEVLIPGSPDAPIFTWTPLHSAYYNINVTVTDPAGAMATAGPIVLYVKPGPSVTNLLVTPTSVEAGQVVTITATVNGGTPPYFYIWTVNGTPTTNPASGDSPTVTWTAPDHTGIYQIGVIASDQVGGAGILSVPVDVYQRIGTQLAIHPLGAIDSGTNMTFVGTYEGGENPVTMTLWQNGTMQAGSAVTNTGTARFPWTQWHGGTYTFGLESVDKLGFTSWSGNYTVVVNGNLSIVLPTPYPATVDVGAYVVFAAGASGGTGPLSYRWTVNGVVDPSDTTATFSTPASTAGTITASVAVEDAHFRQAVAPAVSVNVNPDPNVDIDGPGSLAAGTQGSYSAVVSGGTAPYTYLWAVNETPNSGGSSETYSFGESHAGQFVITVTVIDATGATVISYKAVTVNPSDLGFIPGTTPLESYAVVFGVVVVAVGLAFVFVFVRRRKPKSSPEAPSAMGGGAWAPSSPALPPGGGPPGGAPGAPALPPGGPPPPP
jgi:kumamolisin